MIYISNLNFQNYSLDKRSLALMRICIGAVLLFQTITLYGSAEAFFSDYGLADRDWILNSKVSYHGISKYYTLHYCFLVVKFALQRLF